MIDEMKDRFGSPPEEVSNLMAVMSVRLILKKTGVSKLDVSSESLIFTFSPESHVEPEKVVKLVQRDPHSYQFLSERKLRIKIDEKPSLDALLEAKRITRAWDLSQNK
jgi:transcription-repair coupling factor (superfamily II helicase)